MVLLQAYSFKENKIHLGHALILKRYDPQRKSIEILDPNEPNSTKSLAVERVAMRNGALTYKVRLYNLDFYITDLIVAEM